MRKSIILFLLVLPVALSSQAVDTLKVQDQIDSLIRLHIEYIESGQEEKASQCQEKVELLCIETFGRNSLKYADLIHNLGHTFFDVNDWSRAQEYYLATRNLRSRLMSEDDSVYLNTLQNLIHTYYMLADFNAAKKYMEEVLPIMEKKWGPEDDQYLTYASNLGVLYKELNQFDKAEAQYFKILDISEKKAGRESYLFVSTAINLGLLYTEMGNLSKAEEIYLECYGYFDTGALDKEHEYYYIIITNLGINYWELKEFALAEPLLLESKEIIARKLGKNNIYYPASLVNIGLIYSDMERSDQAVTFLNEAREVFEDSLNNTRHPFYLNCLHDLAKLYLKKGDHSLAEELNLKALQTREELFGRTHKDYGKSLENLLILYLEINDQDKAEDIAKKFYPLLIHQINTAFSFLSNEEREIFIKNEITGIVSLIQMAGVTSSSEDFPELQYDLALLMKGLQLQSSIATLEYIYKGEDQKALATYKQLLEVRNQLAEEYELPLEERMNFHELKSKQDSLEKELARLSAHYRNSQKAASVTAKEVKASLRQGEAVIEFIHFKDPKAGSKENVLYGALVLRPENPHPVFIKLFEEDQLRSLIGEEFERRLDYVDQLYSFSDRGLVIEADEKEDLFHLIWEPISEILNGVEKVYYVPTGLMHKINLGAIPTDEETTLADRYALQALSSSRLLALRDRISDKEIRDAAVFGGVYYDYDTLSIQTAIRGLDRPLEEVKEELSSKGSRPVSRGGVWKYLRWTSKESQKVSQQLTEASIFNQYYDGYLATEEAFKKLVQEGNSPDVIHLATHGFFYDEDQNAENDQTSSVFQKADHSMLRSGLLLAGANNSWSGNEPEGHSEDGILTAYEISQMDLSRTTLVVLSACETGLGEIKGNEGVFGLQRAFKMAGVRYLIMSLWQVPDFQTQDLMTTFYSYWLEEKQSIPDAFRNAQLEMREKYQNPYFWAGFVLME